MKTFSDKPKRLHAATALLLALAALLTLPSPLQANGKKFTLVIDAGHGGNDPGARGSISKEKDINLKVALAFGRYVERNCPDVNVIYTRKTDVFVTLAGRAKIANKAKADLFISIHTNSVAKGKTVRGFEVYTLGMHRAADNLDVAKRENSVITLESDYQSRYQGFDPNSSESYIIFEYMQDKNMENSVKLARLIQANVCQTASRVNKGVHQAGFLVLRETSMPSCLVELGFISTPEEERQLNDKNVQDKLAKGLFQAFQAYRGQQTTATEPPVKAATEASEPEAVPATASKGTKESQSPGNGDSSAPVFRVQIMTSATKLKPADQRFKGVKDTDYYKDRGMYKYTVGSSTDYNEIRQLRADLSPKFPDAFIIAFRNGERMDVNEAIRIWKSQSPRK